MMPRPTTPTVPFFRPAMPSSARLFRVGDAITGSHGPRKVAFYRSPFSPIVIRGSDHAGRRPISGETQMITTGLRSSAARLLGCLASAHAQGLVKTSRLSAALALEAVGEAVAACARDGYAVTAIVVSIDGGRQAVLRGGRAP